MQVRTSKIAFIEHLLEAKIIVKQERALYKNLEALEQKSHHLRQQDDHVYGIWIKSRKNKSEIHMFISLERYFQQVKPKGKLQTMIRS